MSLALCVASGLVAQEPTETGPPETGPPETGPPETGPPESPPSEASSWGSPKFLCEKAIADNASGAPSFGGEVSFSEDPAEGIIFVSGSVSFSAYNHQYYICALKGGVVIGVELASTKAGASFSVEAIKRMLANDRDNQVELDRAVRESMAASEARLPHLKRQMNGWHRERYLPAMQRFGPAVSAFHEAFQAWSASPNPGGVAGQRLRKSCEELDRTIDLLAADTPLLQAPEEAVGRAVGRVFVAYQETADACLSGSRFRLDELMRGEVPGRYKILVEQLREFELSP